MSPEQEDAREDDWDEESEYAPRSIFGAGWFRAVLVLTVLAIVVVVALPYLLNWFEPAPAVVKASPPKQASGPAAAAGSAGSPPTSGAPIAPVAPAPPTATTPSAVAPAAPARARTTPPVTAAAPSAGPPGAERGAAVSAKLAPAREPSGGRYWVQLGFFKDAANAEHLAGNLRQQGFAVEVTRVTRGGAGSMPAGTYSLVRAGGYPDQTRAVAVRDALREKGHAGFVTEGATQ